MPSFLRRSFSRERTSGFHNKGEKFENDFYRSMRGPERFEKL